MLVTSSIFTATKIKLITCSFFGLFTGNISFTLLSDNIVDKPFFSLEIITHDFRLVWSLPILKDRSTGFHAYRIRNTTGIYRTAVHIHGDYGRSHFNLFIIHFSVTIQMRISTFGKYNGIIRLICYRSIQRLFLFRCNSIHRKRIYQCCIYVQGISTGCRVSPSALCTRT